MSRRRIYYDFEFLEDGVTIEPISVGMVDDEGREYYAVFEEIADHDTWGRIIGHDFLSRYVVPHLPLVEREPGHEFVDVLDTYHPDVKKRWKIREEIQDFLIPAGAPMFEGQQGISLWAYFAAYDHVSLAQLWGSMVALPPGIPMRTNDLAQEAERLGVDVLPAHPGTPHHSLHDARHDKLIGEFLIAQNEAWLEERYRERQRRDRVEYVESTATYLFHGHPGAELKTEIRFYNKDVPSDKTLLAIRQAVSLGDGGMSEMDTAVLDHALVGMRRSILTKVDEEFFPDTRKNGD